MTGAVEGSRLSGWGEPYDDCISVQEIKELSELREGWSSWFDRDQIPRLQQRIQEGFEAIA